MRFRPASASTRPCRRSERSSHPRSRRRNDMTRHDQAGQHWWTRLRAGGSLIGLGSLLVLFILLLYLRGQLGNFFSQENLLVLLHSNSIRAVAALGMLLIIISGGIDLSIGSVV